MFPNIEARCIICHLVFCCGDCRLRHEQTAHGLSYDCPICRGFQFLCNPQTLNKDFIDHLSEHLPLHCSKCSQTFSKMEDFTNIDKCNSISELVNDNSVQSITVDEKFDSIYEKSKATEENFEKSKVSYTEKCEAVVSVNKNTKTAIVTPIVRKKNLVDYESSEEEEESMTPHPKSVGKTPKLKRQRYQTPHVKKFLSLMRQTVVEEYEDNLDEESPKTTPVTDNAIPGGQKEITTPTTHVPLLKLVKAVSTSTPTHPAISGWTMFPEQGADSPLSEIENAESPAQGAEASKTELPPKLKSIISTSRRQGSQDSTDKHVTFQESGVSDASMKKKVTFADNTVFDQVKAKRVFRKPKRMLTPGPQRPKFISNPRFQALINRFENHGMVMARTPVTNREKEQETTPAVSELGKPARAIDFKEDSPVVENTTKESNDSFKTCVGSPDMINSITALTANIAGSLQSCLHSALKTTEEETEIQFKFVITKRKVSLKRLAEDSEGIDKESYGDTDKENVWSSVARAVKNVFWGEGSHLESTTPHRTRDSTSSSGSKRKLSELSDVETFPLKQKRHKYSGRLRGRPPLRSGVAALRPSRSYEIARYDDTDEAVYLSN